MPLIIDGEEAETQAIGIFALENRPLLGGLHMLGAHALGRAFLERHARLNPRDRDIGDIGRVTLTTEEI